MSFPSKRQHPIAHVLVVESHQHALEHIHSALRRNKLLGKSWELIHFDAHPDLACGIFPAKACFVPRLEFITSTREPPSNLYDFLDATSAGIAEWILPLVLAANLKKVVWIKPQCSNQLPNGQHSMKVGAWLDTKGESQKIIVQNFLDLPDYAKVKVDWKTPYYFDDDSVRPTEELMLSIDLDLTVMEITQESSNFLKLTDPWMLDICLDYFGCRNPFLDDLTSIDLNYTIYLQQVVQLMTNATTQTKNYAERHQKIKDAFCTLLKSIANEDTVDDALRDLQVTFDNELQSSITIAKFVEHLMKSDKKDVLVQKTLEAQDVLAIPHEQITDTLVQERLALLDTFLQSIKRSDAPFLVTIARSAIDGFTPINQVEQLQSKVVQQVHGFVCGCQGTLFDPEQVPVDCRMKVVLDYGQNEGSTLYD